ncbi:MAG TPA: sugar transferase [Candidatus Limnocylindrales bacterium]|jgi:exopolysaccharide biosynthesis polyprenyl glycosylphosphotransferase
MIRRYGAALRLTLAAADIVLALAVLIGATNLRFGGMSGWASDVNAALPDPGLAAAVFIGMWIAVLWIHGLYRSRARWTRRGDIAIVLRATLVQLALTLSMLYFFKLPNVSRLLLIAVFPSLAAAAIGIRVVVRQILVFARDHGRNVRYMLVLGTSARAVAFADLVESHADLGLVVIGYLKADASEDNVVLDRPLLGMIDDLEAVLHSQIVDEVAICLPFSMEELIEQAVYVCEQEGKVVRIPVAPVERVLTMSQLESVDGVGVYSLANGPDRAVSLAVKRLIDIIGATVLMVVLSPLMAVLGLAIKLDSKGPVLFRQERVGLHGRPIRVLKFRSMSADAEQRLGALRDHNEINGHAFKLANDPRTTRVGRFLRRLSLDELPQLWNVLRGQMSLVGPRPPLPGEVANYDTWHRRRLSMKPGMTGLWQVGARRSPEFDHWVQQDLEYIDSWSLWLDFKIIARTVPAVLSGTGR